MAVKKSALVTIYHVIDGPKQMYEIDASHALRFADQWRREPSFTQDDRDKYLQAQVDAANAEAERTGKPEDKARAADLARQNEAVSKKLAADPPSPAQSAVDIPDGWQDLRPIERINLAASLGEARKGLTAARADEAIQAEVDRREAEPEAPAPVDTKPAPAKSTDPQAPQA